MAQSIIDSLIDVAKTATVGLGIPLGSQDSSENQDFGNLSKSKIKKSIENIFDAAKTGDVSVVKTFVDKHSAEILWTLDSDGSSVLHWAALVGSLSLVTYFIEEYEKSPDHAFDCPITMLGNQLGQTPLHWAAVKGHVHLIDMMLAYPGSDIDAQDKKGCTLLITACQYQQTVVAGYLMAKGAQIQITDNEGDNALHWAASKGCADLVRLLIYSGLNPHQRDSFGQTALHFAAMSGNLNTVQDLCLIDQVEINVRDRNQKTPLHLAVNRRYKTIVEFLKIEIKRRNQILPLSLKTIVFGAPGNPTSAFLFFVMSILFIGYPYYYFVAFPVTYSAMPTTHFIFIACNLFFWFTFYKSMRIDPGFIKRDTPDYHDVMQNLSSYTDWNLSNNPLRQLCHSCRAVRPQRTKHCRICNRCVLLMDHHCPYIYNCVGYNNRHWFIIFLTFEAIMAFLSARMAISIYQNSETLGIIFYTICLLVLLGLFIGGVTSSTMWYYALKNLTLNEAHKWKKYSEFKDAKGSFKNPYNQGVLKNFLLYFHFVKASQKELEYSSEFTLNRVVEC